MQDIIEFIFWLVVIYSIVGLLFAVFFVTKGVGTVDPAAKGTGWGFKLIIIPGLLALWPLFAYRWSKGITEPPEEINAHRLAARKEHRDQ